MKTSRHIFMLSAAVLALAACTQNDWTDSSGLPEGKYPLVIEAGGLENVVSRSTVDGNWEGVTDVALQVGTDVKKYSVESSIENNRWKTATLRNTDNPFYWTSREDIEVEAWWPYDEENLGDIPPVVVKADQSTWGNYRTSDYIYAHSDAVKFENPTLIFTHRTACVTVTLIGGNGITDISEARVVLKGLSTQDGNPASISCNRYSEVPCALVVPQAISSGTKFISAIIDDEVYSYTSNEEINLEANNRYNYTLSLRDNELKLVGCTITDWNNVDNGEIEADIADENYDASTNTYTVNTVEELNKWIEKINAGNVNINCVLDGDIDLSALSRSINNWTPICADYDHPFEGKFDGNNHTISGVIINLPEQNCVGLFGCVGEKGTVKNLVLKDVKINGGNAVGSVVGSNSGTITDCYVTGSVNGVESIGGIAGENTGNITACYSIGNVTGNKYVGGLIGNNLRNLTACYSIGNVEGGDYTGGLVGGNNSSSNTTACYSIGNVKGNSIVGGLAGQNFMGEITACYSLGDVKGTDKVGGVVGFCKMSYVTASYWSGNQTNHIGQFESHNDITNVNKIQDNVTWDSAIGVLNQALTEVGSVWRYQSNNGNDSDGRPLIVVPSIGNQE